MAQRGKPLDAATVRLLQRLVQQQVPVRAIAREVNVARATVRKYTRPPKQ